MAVTKEKRFKPAHKRTSELMKAMGHPARVAILELLAERQTCICGDITDQLPLAQSTVSQHLKALKKSGLIKGEIDGVRTCYCLDEEGITELRDHLLPLINNLTNATDYKFC